MKKTLLYMAAALLLLLLPCGGCAEKTADSCEFIFVSDSQCEPDGLDYQPFAALLERALEQPADFLLHGGDLINDGADQREWQALAAACGDDLQALPWYITLGNHDDVGLAQHFELPDTRYEDSRMLAYSVEYGAAHILVLDGNYLGAEDAELAAWVRDDLAAAGEDCWKLVLSHYSLYPFTDNAKDIQRAEAQRALWEDIFVTGGVDLVLSGHQHHYSRSEAQRGVVYMTVASGGKGGYAPPAQSAGAAVLIGDKRCWQHYQLDAHSLQMTAYDEEGHLIDSLSLNR